MFYVHRLIAELFLENPNKLPDVNHIDEDKSNNCLDNLEWCSRQYNENHGTKKIRELSTKTEKQCINGRKSICQYDLHGNFIKNYDSLMQASSENNISIGNISSVINGKRKMAGGYIWKKM